MLDEALKNVSIIGAAGKMGSGISLLMLQEMARVELEKSNSVGTGRYCLNLIDTNEKALQDLKGYLYDQMIKYAEKNIVGLRNSYKDQKKLIENSDIITDFAQKAVLIVKCDTDLGKVKNSSLIFEAIIEDAEIKTELLKKLKAIAGPQAFYFTNTSSVPISLLDENVKLDGRIIGYHFYNPPAVQKLVEVICAKNTKKELADLANELGKRLKKTLVPSNDVPGFIGNGHFLRDVLYSISLFDELKKNHEFHEAVYLVNRITQDFMVRPMGIFQLHDYVGVDVCGHILRIMKTYLKDSTFESKLIHQMIEMKIIGGQYANGSQKDGFLKYEGNKIAAVYNLDTKRYVPFAEGGWKKKCDDALGALPGSHLPWKALLKDPGKDEKLKTYFKDLFNEKTMGAELARKYLLKSREIARTLVEKGVAREIGDVNKVLENGFFHIYGPENKYF